MIENDGLYHVAFTFVSPTVQKTKVADSIIFALTASLSQDVAQTHKLH
jgi:hypothetical protein